MDAERDKREARKISYFERYSPGILRILMYGKVDKIKLGKRHYLASYFVLKQIIFTVQKIPMVLR